MRDAVIYFLVVVASIYLAAWGFSLQGWYALPTLFTGLIVGVFFSFVLLGEMNV